MKRKKIISVVFLTIILFILTSCWNYREVNQLNIVVGAAIDKGETKNYMITVELISVKDTEEVNVSSEVLSIEGDTLFDAVRRFNSVTGKRAYWAHIQTVIISEEIANEDLYSVLNFFREDAETRSDVFVVISKECKAKDILDSDVFIENMVAETINRSLSNSQILSEFKETTIFTASKDLKSDKKAATVPTVSLLPMDGKEAPFICGTAVFRDNKLVCLLDGKETKDMLFLSNEIKGGVIVTQYKDFNISLEILENTTKIKTSIENDIMTVDVYVDTQVAIDEADSSVDFSDLEVLGDIEKQSRIQLLERLETTIGKAKYYEADIFGFTQRIYENHSKKWSQMSNGYEKKFSNININLSVKIRILNTAKERKL